MAILEDAQADFEQASEHLTAQRESITRSIGQAAALKAELERVWLALEEQVNVLTKDFFVIFLLLFFFKILSESRFVGFALFL